MKALKYLLTATIFLASMATYAQWQGTNPVYFNAGNVGIGTASPGMKLDVQGGAGIRIGANTYDANLLFGNNPASWMSGIRVYDNGDAEMRIWHMANQGQIILTNGYNGNQSTAYPTDGVFIVGDAAGNTNRIGIGYNAAAIRGGNGKLMVNGNVGIGTANPSSKLVIDGIDNYTNGITIQNTASYKHLITAFSDGTSPSGGSALQFKVANDNTGGNSAVMTLKGSGNVGIGTASPQSTLDVRGNIVSETGTNPIFYAGVGSSELNRYLLLLNSTGLHSASGLMAGGILIADSYTYASPGKNDLIVKGNVGIGTPTPAYKLDVNGPINAASLNINGQPLIGTQWTTAGASISYTGKVGIGTTLTNNPNNYSLAVNGTIGAKDVRVEKSSTTWPDYVFDNSYDLPSLKELENYIQEHKHLADVPSAKTVEEKGYSLNEMDVILLKKVEELSLYVIQQQKEIDELKKKLEVNK